MGGQPAEYALVSQGRTGGGPCAPGDAGEARGLIERADADERGEDKTISLFLDKMAVMIGHYACHQIQCGAGGGNKQASYRCPTTLT